MTELKRNRAGTVYFTDLDGTMRYQCQYCDTWFIPKAKFKQKYCCGSCRTMASNERNDGLAGSYATKREATSNADLLHELKAIRKSSEEILQRKTSDAFDAILNRQHQTDLKMVQEIRQYAQDMNRKMEWLMLIAAIAPVVSPAAVNWLKAVAFGEKPSTDLIMDQLSDLKSKLDEKTKAELKEKLKEQKLDDIANSLLGV